MNNIQYIKKIIEETTLYENEYFVVRLVERSKDTGRLGNQVGWCRGCTVHETIPVRTIKDVENILTTYIPKCDELNYRLYFNPTCHTFDLDNVLELSEKSKDILSRCAIYRNSLFVVDVDEWAMDKISQIEEYFGNFIKYKIPSKSGYHLLTTNYNHKEFREKFPKVDVLRGDGLGLNLYIPSPEKSC